jgi:hypothetical protein
MFTLEQQIFIVQHFFNNGERLGPIRHLEFLRNFNKSFRTFQALNQQLAQKVYKCVNMFLETGSVLRKKPKKLTYHLVQFSLSLKKICTFFLYRVSVVHEINSLTILIVGALAPTTDNNLSG